LPTSSKRPRVEEEVEEGGREGGKASLSSSLSLLMDEKSLVVKRLERQLEEEKLMR